MLTKKQVLDVIGAMPEDQFKNVENIIEEILLLEKVNKGLEDIENGNVISNEELNSEIKKW